MTIGTDNDDLIPILKIWRIDDTESKKNTENLFESANIDLVNEEANKTPIETCIRTIKLSQSNPQLATLRQRVSATVIDVLNESSIAVGFNDGNCLIIKGDLIRNSKNVKMQLFQVSPNESSITGLAFSSYTRTFKLTSKTFRTFNTNTSSTRQHIILFVSTRNEICSFDLSNKDIKDSKIILGLNSLFSNIFCC